MLSTIREEVECPFHASLAGEDVECISFEWPKNGYGLNAVCKSQGKTDIVDIAKLEKKRCPRPTEFASVFSFGYAKDEMPKEDDAIDRLLGIIKEGGFNVVHCVYTDKRLELCKKHGIKMMVDLLEEERHVFRSPDKAKELCERLQKNPDVWGYNIWNDPFGKSGRPTVTIEDKGQWRPVQGKSG